VIDIRGLGLMQGLELVQNRSTGEPFPRTVDFAGRVAAAALERDLWIYPCGSGPVDDGILVGPPFTVTEAHIETIVGVLVESIDVAAASIH